jgi:signal transduction histidine kinase
MKRMAERTDAARRRRIAKRRQPAGPSSPWKLLAVLLPILGTFSAAPATGQRPAFPGAELAEDGRSFTLSVPGLGGFRAGFLATVECGGRTQVLDSAAGRLAGPPQGGSLPTPFGAAETTDAVLRFEREGMDLLFRLGRLPGGKAFFARAGVRNGGTNAVRLVSLTPVASTMLPAGAAGEWLLTGLNPATPAVSGLDGIGAGVDVHECGGLYRPDGAGFLFGPSGEPSAYVSARFEPASGGRLSLRVTAEMSRVRVDPGATRWGQEVALWMDGPAAALAGWAEWVGATHDARAAAPALTGWSSWNFFGRDVTGADVLEVVAAAAKDPERLRPDVIQIDAGYAPDKFPDGIGAYAQRIAGIGARPGLKLDLRFGTSPVDLVRTATRRGFRYLKLGCAGAGADPPGNRTSFEALRDLYAAARAAAGPDAYLLYCGERPNRAVVGLVDASRTGRQALRTDLRAAIDDVLRSYALNGRWFAVDCDSYYMGTDIANVSEIAGGWPLVRTWLSMVGLSCGAAITCDPWHWDSFAPYRRTVEILTPPANERTEVPDLLTAREWPRLVGRTTRDWGGATVALLWNPGGKERTVTLDFAAAGMDPHHRHAVWSFWDNRYLGVAEGSWTTPALAPAASQHLCFTDLDRAPSRPVLIGSSLHIYCGAAEIRHVTSLQDAMEIELTDAGARDGDLFVYSRYPPVLKAAAGCTVTGIGKGGENVWRIGLRDRRRGAPQRIELGIPLPVTRQRWFWALVALAAAGLLFGAWRYAAGLRLQREHALARERARIARDMHDEVGSKLARLSLLGEMAGDEPSIGPGDRARVQEIARGVREAAGELEHIIWSVNPRHDSLADLAHRIFQHAEEYFAETPVRCRFAMPPDLPELPMRPDARAAAFGAVKEALANVLKHAAATEVEIRVRIDGCGAEVCIIDDGRGFDPAHSSETGGGNGLANLRERMERLGGSCRIESAPGSGTTVTLRWPLEKGRANGGE